ncbi:MAG: hydrogenase, partial [Sulfuricurvum sp.]|nr:hydrogenase [Sulfuricurvum sp.]
MSDRVEAVKKLFTSKSSRVETNKGDTYYQDLFVKCEARLNEMRAQAPANRLDFSDLLEDNGIDRREFMKWASATTAMLMLPPMFTPLIADAV